MIGDMQGYNIYACKDRFMDIQVQSAKLMQIMYVQEENFKVTRVAFSSLVNQLYANC